MRFSYESLTTAEAEQRFREIGPNEIPEQQRQNFIQRHSKLLKEPMILILIATASLYLFMGDLGEGLLLGFSVLFVIGISIYQEHKSERALEALKNLSSPRALVIRDGIEKRIPARELVPGDVIHLHEGDRIPADGTLLDDSHFSVDESLLTGESLPVKKKVEGHHPETSVFSGTLAVEGKAIVRVTQTGIRSEAGKIGLLLKEAPSEEPHLSREIRQIVWWFAWGGLVLCLIIGILYGISRKNWIDAILLGLSTEMAILPEEFPVVLTVFLVMGAWRLSKANVLVRAPSAIERLGAVTVLCVDKTGTLTQNQMSLVEIRSANDSVSEEDLLSIARLASHRNPFDPMEKAIQARYPKTQNKDSIRDYPLKPPFLAFTRVWENPEHPDSLLIATKGAPESVLSLCSMTSEEREKLLKTAAEMAQKGQRILGVAQCLMPIHSREAPASDLPDNLHALTFKWLGLLAFEDPLRPEVPKAVEECRKAGIRVIMMTGDHPDTALKIAEQAGLDTQTPVISGAELETINEETLIKTLKKTHLFARMIPQQKLRIVKLLKNSGEVVAMTGDGVNDAPSLKFADVGIAMGSRGTDVAREASDLVLTDDHFASIVGGIRMGRLIFSNIKKALSYIVSIHVPIAGLSILPVILDLPILLMPIHIVFLELIIDPACTFLFESFTAESDVMNQKPRSVFKRLFQPRDYFRSALQGFFVLIVISTVYFLRGDHSRSMVFLMTVICNLSLILADLSGGSLRHLRVLLSKSVAWMIGSLIGITLVAIFTLTSLRDLFRFDPLSLMDALQAFGISGMTFFILWFWKPLK